MRLVEPAHAATHSPRPRPSRRIRLAVLDDNPFVRDGDGSIRPAAALFSRFVEAVVATGPFEPAAYLAPVRDLEGGEAAPALRPIDRERLRFVPTSPFEGIHGYVRGAPGLIARNWPVIRDAVAAADLVWIKAPASNAPLAALACRRSRTPRFTWVAGSVRQVASAQAHRGPAALAAAALGILYDGMTRILERTGPSIRLDDELFTSVVTREDVDTTRRWLPAAPPDGQLRLAWAGRMAAEKGLDDLLAAVADLRAAGIPATLDAIGDGPVRPSLEARAAELGLGDAVRWRGYLGDRAVYLDALRSADLFVLPSHAEGMPKVLVEAMAAGLPVVATRVGAVATLLDDGPRGRLVPAGAPGRLAEAIRALADDEAARAMLRERGLKFAAAHTAETQAERLIAWMRRTFPTLPWPVPEHAT